MVQWRGKDPPCWLQPGEEVVVEVGQGKGREGAWAGGVVGVFPHIQWQQSQQTPNIDVSVPTDRLMDTTGRMFLRRQYPPKSRVSSSCV